MRQIDQNLQFRPVDQAIAQPGFKTREALDQKPSAGILVRGTSSDR